MTMEWFHQLNEQLKPGRENCRQGGCSEVTATPLALQLAAQEERRRIAQELHDTLLQGFAGIALKLDALTTSLPPALAKTKQELFQALEQMDDYLAETRRAICNLRSAKLETIEDFSTVLRKTSERVLAGTALTLSFSVEGAARKIGNALEHHLLRICEEALANVLKHSSATRVGIILSFTTKEVQLQIRDNGCGFKRATWKAARKEHFGLLGIQERVAALCGAVSVEGAPRRGTRLIVTIPTESVFHANARRIPEDRNVTESLLIRAQQ